MLFNLYLLTTLYTNTMGLIIIAKCNPIIKREIELNGYKIKEKDDTEYVINIMLLVLKFLITGYYLNKALKLTNKNFDIQKIIQEKLKEGEIENSSEKPIGFLDDSIFRDDRKKALSNGKYEKMLPYKANSSMYTKDRYPNKDEVDMDFWEEEEQRISSYIEETKEEDVVVKKEPLKEYFDSMSEDDIKTMMSQLETIRRLKKENDELLNKN